jgi:esterase/lipase superfamily enzyme
MATEKDWRDTLRDLLVELFETSANLERFLVENQFISAARVSHFRGDILTYSSKVVRSLHHRGLIDERFFKRLQQARPEDEARIEAVHERWLAENMEAEAARGPLSLGERVESVDDGAVSYSWPREETSRTFPGPLVYRLWRALFPRINAPGSHSRYRLWYGTNRRPFSDKNMGIYYDDRDDETLHYGTCTVYIPKSHEIGSLGSRWWRRWLTWKDDRLRLIDVSQILPNEFWGGVRDAVAKLDLSDRTAVVFIHGYNVDFRDSALRAAQIGADLQIPGVMAFYSWPSLGTLSGYLADGASVEASERFITEFLTQFAVNSGASLVHVIAHSMGNRGLLRAFQRMSAKAERESSVKFGQVILAAPDIDVRLFRELAFLYPKLAKRTTMYVSAMDRALAAAGLFHGDYPRAGFTPPHTVVSGVDTVDVTNTDLTQFGHGYIGASRDVLYDMYMLIVNDLPPERRMGLRHYHDLVDGSDYWLIGE